MPERTDKIEPRSMKRGRWYWVDKAVIQERARAEGLLTISVYHFLASMADESQSCYPSQKYIAKKLGCSRSSVNKAVKRLVWGGLISAQKNPGKTPVYHLLPLEMSSDNTDMSRTSTPDVVEEDTNKNKVTRNNNDDIVGVHKSYDDPEKRDDIRSRRELLAHDITEGLDDRDHFPVYLSYAERYPEPFLRRVLAQTKLTPDGKIRKSRAALFKYLVNHYERRN